MVDSIVERFRSEHGTDSSNRMPSALPNCQLGAKSCSCRGVGIKLIADRVLARAEICSCVGSCARCRGQARMITDGHSKPCRVPEPQRLVGLFNAAQIPSKYVDARLAAFDNFTGNGRAILNQIKTWLQSSRQSPQKGLMISGPVGVGKTYLLTAIAYELMTRGLTVKFVDFFQLLATLRSAYSAGEGDRAVLDPLCNVDVLIIDEMGKGRNSEWEQTVLDSLVMNRYNSNRIIIASTNYPLFVDNKAGTTHRLDLEELSQKSAFSPDVFEPFEQRVGKRIFSRLVEMSIFVELTGEDFRRVGRRPAASAPRTPWE